MDSKSIIKILSISLFLFSSCIDVSDNEIAKLSITPDSAILYKGQMLYLGIIINGRTLNESENVKWQSEDTCIVKVSASGCLSAIGEGKTSVMAFYKNGESEAKCKVTVLENFNYKFRITLKEKGVSSYDIGKPETFLSAKAVERRVRHNIPIDENDLPISDSYIDEICKIGGVIVSKSKWLKTVTIYCEHENMIELYRKLPFVKDVEIVWRQAKSLNNAPVKRIPTSRKELSNTYNNVHDSTFYGSAWNNINVCNGQYLHVKGYSGSGIDIAVIDEGFSRIPSNPALLNIAIKGSKSFIYEDSDPYNRDDHGVWVLSCMAGNTPGFYVGTAPEANYWLLRAEDTQSEQAVEEDYWVSAIEFADSVGVDVVNTSLYYEFLDWNKYNGKTAFTSRAANIATQKGILIVCCAGNTSAPVGSPSDSPDILTVGAINLNKTIAGFSSYGMTVDGRIKPDISALGSGVGVINPYGLVDYRNGTSYSSPIICGLAACLWQAFPKLSNLDIIDIIIQSSDRYVNPVLPYGYGIPNMEKAYFLAHEKNATIEK